MTDLLHRQATSALPTSTPPTPSWAIGTPRLLAGLDSAGVLDARTHLAVHGPLPATDLGHLLGLLDAAHIAGRGGAGFDLAHKIRALRGAREVIVNGCESEPGSHKDRTLLTRSPHLVLDGALVLASAIGARTVTVAVHDPGAAQALRGAVAARPDSRHVRVRMVPGGFVSGEARALIRALAGGPARPPGRQTHSTDKGILLSNAESVAQVAILLRLGSHRYGSSGTAAEPGTTLLTVGGAVTRPGVVEIPLGTPLEIVLYAAGSAPPQAVVIGGYHGSWHAPPPGLLLSRAGLAAAGGSFGAGVLLVLDQNTCALGELARVARWLAAQSTKQCGPCRFGLPALAQDVVALYRGAPAEEAAHRHSRAVLGRGACHHPDGAVRFVTSGLRLLRDEVQSHRHGGCGRPILGQLPVTS
jgi:NADH:ubiquinone oxidoreductase subunit F (NADH-binding)